MNSTRKVTKYGYTLIGEFRSADVRCSRITGLDSIECIISSSACTESVILTKPRLLAEFSVSLESLKERIEGRWNLVSVKRRNGDPSTYILEFHGEDDLLGFSLTCDTYRKLPTNAKDNE